MTEPDFDRRRSAPGRGCPVHCSWQNIALQRSLFPEEWVQLPEAAAQVLDQPAGAAEPLICEACGTVYVRTQSRDVTLGSLHGAGSRAWHPRDTLNGTDALPEVHYRRPPRRNHSLAV